VLPPRPATDWRAGIADAALRARALAGRAAVLALMLATGAYAVAILAGQPVVSLRSLGLVSSTMDAAALDLALLAIFAVHFHFRQLPYLWLTRSQLDRPPARHIRDRPPALYIRDRLVASALVLAFFFAWQPLGQQVWCAEGALATALFHAALASGWMLFLSCGIAHETSSVRLFHKLAARAGGHEALQRRLRAGIVAGLLLIEWSAARMSLEQLVVALSLGAYLLWAYANGARRVRG
jgi:hypothetical protein